LPGTPSDIIWLQIAMSFSQDELLEAIAKVWTSAKKMEPRSLYSIMILIFCFFDKLPYFAEKNKPEKVELLKFILIEKYLHVYHDEDLINMFVNNRLISKKMAGKRNGLYRSVLRTITHIRRLMLKIRCEPPFDYDQLDHYKSIVFYLKTKLKLYFFLDRNNGLIYSLIRNKISVVEGRLGRKAIRIPFEFINVLFESGYHSSAISLNNYPSLRGVSLKAPDKVCQSLWLYSLSQRNLESTAPFLQKVYGDVKRNFDSIGEHLLVIQGLTDSKWHHQDFLINFLAMKYQLLALETHLENIFSINHNQEMEKYELLRKSQKLYRQLEKYEVEVVNEVYKGRELICKSKSSLKASLAGRKYEAIINVYSVVANPNINPMIDCFVMLNGKNILLFNVYISENYHQFEGYLKGLSELLNKYKEVIIVVENFTQELFAIFKNANASLQGVKCSIEGRE
jgi:hypothetical protein